MPKPSPRNCPHCRYDRKFPGTAWGGWIYTGNNGPVVACPVCNADGTYPRSPEVKTARWQGAYVAVVTTPPGRKFSSRPCPEVEQAEAWAYALIDLLERSLVLRATKPRRHREEPKPSASSQG